VQQHTSLPTTLLLIRHAQAADRDPEGELLLSGQVDLALTRQGRLQAERLRRLAARLCPIDAVYSSTLRRAIDTARPLAEELGLLPRAWPTLRESSCGRLDGLSIAEVRRKYPRLWQTNMAQSDNDFRWPGGETYAQFRREYYAPFSGLPGHTPVGAS
jgi:2,3-bisphosphoglycerate-dependent phosphoglycerate mutase